MSQPQYDVFLSSCFRDPVESGDLGDLREETRLRFERKGLAAWTWEHWEKSGGPNWVASQYTSYPASFADIAVFRTALMRSEVVIVFVSKRRGSQISPWHDLTAYGTFFEIEVFFATALGKPIILFREPGHAVEPPLEQLLAVAKRSGTIVHEEQIDRTQLPRKSVEAFLAVRRRLRSPIRKFTTFLAKRRDPELDFRSTQPFLFGESLPQIEGKRVPDVDAFDRLLASEQERGLPVGERMSRTWLALQELLPFRDMIVQDSELGRRWLAALDVWGSSASWFGLHSHLVVSPLVAQAERARLVTSSPSLKLPIPYGPLSSARYSMARRQMLGRRRSREMDKVIEEATLAIASGVGDVAGYRSIVGFALIQKGRFSESAEAFETSLRLRRLEADSGSEGEGLADLGLALFMSGRPWRGTALMKEGVDLLGNSDRRGAHLRAMKKLEFAYFLTGRWRKAHRLRRQRMGLALTEQYYDQL